MEIATPARPVLSDALLIAGFTACSYAVGYAYRAGFADHFGIPTILVAPTLTTILEAAAALGGAIVSYLFFANVVWTFIPRTGSAVSRAVHRFVALSLVLGFMASVQLKYWVFFAVLMLIYGFFEFVFPLLTQRRAHTYEEKIKAQDKIEDQGVRDSLIGHFANAFGRNSLGLVLLLMLAILAANMLGLKSAEDKAEFYVLKGAPNSVAVSIDGEVLVSADFDPKTKTLTGTYEVRRLSDSKPWSLRLERVGPLKSPSKGKEKSSNAKP